MSSARSLGKAIKLKYESGKPLVLHDYQLYEVDGNDKAFEILDCLATDILSQRDDVVVLPQNMCEEGESTEDLRIVKRVKNDGHVKGARYLFRTQQFVGYLNVDGCDVSIVSRFSQTKDLSTDFFFNHMLSKSLDGFTLFDASSQQLGVSQGDFTVDRAIAIYSAVFINMLKSSLRKGLLKEYVLKERNDSNVRGKVDVARHIRMNMPFVGKIAYTQREHSTDNALTEIVRHTIEYLGSQRLTRTWLDRAQDEVRQIIDATPSYRKGDLRRIIEKNRNNPVTHPYYHEYRDLQRLCLLILLNQRFKFNDGRTHGVLFNSFELWEEYLNALMEKDFYHPNNREGYRKGLKEGGGHFLFRSGGVVIYPDFIGKKTDEEGRHLKIADAKYKPLMKQGGKAGESLPDVKREDWFQILAYMMRFGSNLGYLLFPLSGEIEEDLGKEGMALRLCSPGDASVTLLGLVVPSKYDDHNDFEIQMKKSEERFCEALGIDTDASD